MFAAPSRRRALPLPVRLRAVPARAARVVRRAPHPRRPRPHRRRRRRPDAAPPRLHREPRARAAARRSTSPTPRPGKIFNVGDEEVLTVRQVDRARRARRSATRSRSCRCRTSSRCRPGRCSRSRCRPTACSTSAACAHELGYRDVVPAREAVGATARWLADAPAARRAARRRWCSPTRSTTRPRTGSSTRGTPRSARCPIAGVRHAARLRPRLQRPRRPAPHQRGVRRVTTSDRIPDPLAGIRILDLSIALTGPYAAALLGRPGRRRSSRSSGRASATSAAGSASSVNGHERARTDRATAGKRSHRRRRRTPPTGATSSGGSRPTPTWSCRTSGPASSTGSASATTTLRAVNERPRLRVALGLRRRPGRTRARAPTTP